MTTIAAPSFGQIKAMVVSVRQKLPKARVIGIHSPASWTEKSLWEDGDHQYSIKQCDSPLAFRVALRESLDENTTKVLITHLNDQELGDDVLLRLAKRKLMQLDPWQTVRSLFEAHAIDPRLTKFPWLAEALLDAIPKSGFSPARGGFLDAETVWPLLLSDRIGLDNAAPDLVAIVRWSLDHNRTNRYRACDGEFRSAANDWLVDKAGSATAIVLDCIERLERADAVPIGLVAGVVFHESAAGKLEKATGKLEERYFAGQSLDPDDMRRWASAAGDLIRSLRPEDAKLTEKTIGRADEILKEIGADQYAYLSGTSRVGFDQRLADFGTRLSASVSGSHIGITPELVEAAKSIRDHDQHHRESRRIARVEMAVRLIRWIGWKQTHESSPQSFDEAAEGHLRDGGFVDWARLSLRSGDPVRVLSEAYAQLFDRVTQIQEEHSRTFAKLLVDWTASGSQSEEVVPVESVLNSVVAPLAASGLVLVVVVDGMSVAVARELLTDLTRHEWTQISEPGRSFNRPGLATIPSVTEFSRTSLLSGQLIAGNQNIERKRFENHAGLLEHCRSGSPPVLFHKAGLSEEDDSVLAAEVRKEIASTHRRVVGVVVNAVDDHLLKGEQIDTRWTRDEIKVLPALLHEARIARRLVVLVSDHGHVLDCGAEGKVYKDEQAGGERWRAAIGEAEANEFVIEGSRVVPAPKKIVAPWSERIRYGIKKNGYHGGLTPQEMIAPIVVLASTDDLPDGWSEQPIDTPSWWDEAATASESIDLPKPTPKLKPVEKSPPKTLFDLQVEENEVKSVEADFPTWISRFLACPIFKDQKRFGGRGVPSDEIFANLLSSLDSRGGKLRSAALARTLECPAMRLPGLLAKAERVLNIDGYDVLRRDDASDTVELDRDLLLKQFDLVEQTAGQGK